VPRATDTSYPFADSPDDDDWSLFIQDGTFRRISKANLKTWLGVDGTVDVVYSAGAGPVLTAANGEQFRLTVSNTGVPQAVALSQPQGGIATGVVLSSPLSTDFNLISGMVPGGFLRSDYSWKVAEGTQGSYSWGTFDTRIAAINAAGLRTLAMLGYSPTWANGGNADDKVAPLAGFEDEWQEYCRRFAERYIPQGVTVFELWNEPNITTFWKPTPNVYDYVNRILIPGANGLRAAADALGVGITILSAGTAPASSGTVTQRTVTNKALTSNVATLTTSVAHGYTVGRIVDVRGVDSTFDGGYMITATPTTTTFSYVKVAADVASTADTGTADSGTGTNIDPRMFAHGVYGNGGRDYFDAYAHHPYTWPFPPNQDDSIAFGSYNPNQWNTMVQTRRIREIMVTYGDSAKRIWATEVGAPSRDASPTYPTTGHQNFVSHATLATRINEIFDYWFALEGAGPLIWYQHRNQASEPLGTNTEGGFGIVYNSGTDKPNGVRSAITAKFAQYA
jgi:hypothetical protein